MKTFPSGGKKSISYKVKVTDFISEYNKSVLHQVHSNFHTHQQWIKTLISPICAKAEYYHFENLYQSDREENGYSLMSTSHLLVIHFPCVHWLLYWSFAHFLNFILCHSFSFMDVLLALLGIRRQLSNALEFKGKIVLNLRSYIQKNLSHQGRVKLGLFLLQERFRKLISFVPFF